MYLNQEKDKIIERERERKEDAERDIIMMIMIEKRDQRKSRYRRQI